MSAKEPVYTHSFRYPIQDLKPGETVLEKFGDLSVHSVLLDNGFGPDKDPFLRYIIYLSEGSGLHAAIPEWVDRKKEALRLAGVKPDNPRYHAVLELSDEPVADMRWAWLRAFSSRKFRAYVALSESFDQNCRKIETPISDGDDQKEDAVQRAYKLRDELGRGLSQLDKDIAGLEASLFMGDEEMKRAATERMKPQAEAGSFEDRFIKRNKK